MPTGATFAAFPTVSAPDVTTLAQLGSTLRAEFQIASTIDAADWLVMPAITATDEVAWQTVEALLATCWQPSADFLQLEAWLTTGFIPTIGADPTTAAATPADPPQPASAPWSAIAFTPPAAPAQPTPLTLASHAPTAAEPLAPRVAPAVSVPSGLVTDTAPQRLAAPDQWGSAAVPAAYTPPDLWAAPRPQGDDALGEPELSVAAAIPVTPAPADGSSHSLSTLAEQLSTLSSARLPGNAPLMPRPAPLAAVNEGSSAAVPALSTPSAPRVTPPGGDDDVLGEPEMAVAVTTPVNPALGDGPPRSLSALVQQLSTLSSDMVQGDASLAFGAIPLVAADEGGSAAVPAAYTPPDLWAAPPPYGDDDALGDPELPMAATTLVNPAPTDGASHSLSALVQRLATPAAVIVPGDATITPTERAALVTAAPPPTSVAAAAPPPYGAATPAASRGSAFATPTDLLTPDWAAAVIPPEEAAPWSTPAAALTGKTHGGRQPWPQPRRAAAAAPPGSRAMGATVLADKQEAWDAVPSSFIPTEPAMFTPPAEPGSMDIADHAGGAMPLQRRSHRREATQWQRNLAPSLGAAPLTPGLDLGPAAPTHQAHPAPPARPSAAPARAMSHGIGPVATPSAWADTDGRESTHAAHLVAGVARADHGVPVLANPTIPLSPEPAWPADAADDPLLAGRPTVVDPALADGPAPLPSAGPAPQPRPATAHHSSHDGAESEESTAAAPWGPLQPALSPGLSAADLALILDALAREITHEYRRFYGE